MFHGTGIGLFIYHITMFSVLNIFKENLNFTKSYTEQNRPITSCSQSCDFESLLSEAHQKLCLCSGGWLVCFSAGLRLRLFAAAGGRQKARCKSAHLSPAGCRPLSGLCCGDVSCTRVWILLLFVLFSEVSVTLMWKCFVSPSLT